MEIHTYRAASLQEALLLVRHELGPDASVLQTREVSGRFFGLLGKSCIEVQASRDAKVLRRLPNATAAAITASIAGSSSSAGFDVSEDESVVHRAASSLHHDNFSSDHASDDETFGDDSSNDDLRTGDAALRSVQAVGAVNGAMNGAVNGAVNGAHEYRAANRPTMRRAAEGRGGAMSTRSPAGPATNYLSPAMFEVFTEMLDAEVEPDAARTMLQEVAAHCTSEQLGDAWLIKARLCQVIQQQINIAGPIELDSGTRQVIALVGPTGVGKTTTLAKLAAGFHFDQGTSVGFVTLDTFRLGAVDQLQKYADLLGAPCEVVSAPDQMVPALERLDHCRLIFIDTAGRSPRDRAQLETLGDFLRVACPTQIHLVLSAASSQTHARSALEHFAPLNPTHLLLTKLDESTGLGSWYRLLSSGTWPLSYVTTGQHVPEDILVANRRRVASLILGQTNHLTWK